MNNKDFNLNSIFVSKNVLFLIFFIFVGKGLLSYDEERFLAFCQIFFFFMIYIKFKKSFLDDFLSKLNFLILNYYKNLKLKNYIYILLNHYKNTFVDLKKFVKVIYFYFLNKISTLKYKFYLNRKYLYFYLLKIKLISFITSKILCSLNIIKLNFVNFYYFYKNNDFYKISNNSHLKTLNLNPTNIKNLYFLYYFIKN